MRARHLAGMNSRANGCGVGEDGLCKSSPRIHSPGGFTLIELLIVIAIVLITIAGEVAVTRNMIRSTNNARDMEAASSILSSELAQLRNQGIKVSEGFFPLPIPPQQLSQIPGDASGEVRLLPRSEGGLVEAQAILRWRSVIGPRELSMSTLLRVSGGKE